MDYFLLSGLTFLLKKNLQVTNYINQSGFVYQYLKSPSQFLNDSNIWGFKKNRFLKKFLEETIQKDLYKISAWQSHPLLLICTVAGGLHNLHVEPQATSIYLYGVEVAFLPTTEALSSCTASSETRILIFFFPFIHLGVH